MHHATLGIIGMGRIGQTIAKRAAGFDMKVIYNNRRRLSQDIERRLNATYASKDELLAQADFVVLQVPYSPETHHLIGAAELGKMKPSAILINSTRGGVVDDAALIEALNSGASARSGARRVRERTQAQPRISATEKRGADSAYRQLDRGDAPGDGDDRGEEPGRRADRRQSAQPAESRLREEVAANAPDAGRKTARQQVERESVPLVARSGIYL